ncbi:MAG: HEAT repeat domain-containing protein [Myxococcota bacterium]
MARTRHRAAALAALLALAGTAVAQDRETLVEALRHAVDFRLQVQAAFAMGTSGDASFRAPLEQALGDDNPAVRAAAATALGRLGDRRAIPALERLLQDSSAAVRLQAGRSIEVLRRPPPAAASPAGPATAPLPRPSIDWDRVRYVVVVGGARDQTNDQLAPALLVRMVDALAQHLLELPEVAVFESVEDVDAGTRREMRRRHVDLLRVDAELKGLTRSRSGSDVRIEVAVNVMLVSESGALRSLMGGAAAGEEPGRQADPEQEARLARQALAVAMRTAMAQVPAALASTGPAPRPTSMR